MKTSKIFLIILFLFIAAHSYCQTGSMLIYDSENLGITQFQSFKINNAAQRHIYVQLGCSQDTPPPNSTGRFIKLNRQNNSWYTPYNNFLNSHWVYEGVNGFWSCNPVGYAVMSPFDSNIIIKHSKEIVSDCCPVEVNKITWNSGISDSTSTETGIPDFSTFCGMDIDTTNGIFEKSVYFYAYKIYYSFNNIVNAIIRVSNYYPGYPVNQEITDTIPSLKSFSAGGFLKINPFNRNYIFTSGNNLLLSTTSGTNFFSVNIPAVKKLIFSESDRKIYGFTSSKLYNSSDNGLSWDSVPLPYDFAVMESNPDSAHIFYAGNENGLYISGDHGISWALYNNSFNASKNVTGLSKDNLSGDTLIVCTDREVYIVWASFIVGINNVSTEFPQRFSLEQNYPNPFNPVTVISYSLMENSFVNLKVYDVLGNEIATLVNEKQNRGIYNYQFSTVNYQLSSGIYFYKLTTDGFNETKRMVLLK